MERVQKDINSSMRAMLVDWLVEVIYYYFLSHILVSRMVLFYGKNFIYARIIKILIVYVFSYPVEIVSPNFNSEFR